MANKVKLLYIGTLRNIIIDLLYHLKYTLKGSIKIKLGCIEQMQPLLFQNERELTNNQTVQILLAIENKDKDSIRQMFSKSAVSESENFDGDIEKLFEYFRGELISFNKDGTYVPYMESGGEGTMKLVDYQNVVRTSEDTYLLTTRYYIADTVIPDNVGIYSFNILNLEEYRKYDKPEKQENIEYLPGINMKYIKQWADYHWLGIAEYGKED